MNRFLDSDVYANQWLISDIDDHPEPWTNLDMWRHYRDGNGEAVTLSHIGRLGEVIDYFADHATSDNK